jgi:hypothetical protein
VKLRRKEKSIIADKTKMFDLFTRMLNRSQKAEDFELTKYAQEAADFWTLMMLEEHHHDQIFINNMYDMQDACQTWLDELLFILEGRAHAGATKEIKELKTSGANQELRKQVRATGLATLSPLQAQLNEVLYIFLLYGIYIIFGYSIFIYLC